MLQLLRRAEQDGAFVRSPQEGIHKRNQRVILMLDLFRALGTPLDWPEAKNNANHVREWGIKVYFYPERREHGLMKDLWVAIVGDLEQSEREGEGCTAMG